MRSLCLFFAIIFSIPILGMPGFLNQQKNCSIKGKVIDSSTEETIAFATVVIYDKNRKSIGGVISG
ncbi:MAG: hypothetical protein WBN50_09090, partial [Lutimonas sp.]